MTDSNWTRRSILTGLAGGAASFLGAADRPPNIVFLLLDDLGWRDFGCYGNSLHETPNVDHLAAEGVRFTNAYAACPVCSPTRASIMTGKYPARLHLTDWIAGRKQWPTSRLLVPPFEQQLPLAETTVAEALQPLGYRSASIGKWHLGGEGFWPEQQGFDVNVAGYHRGSPPAFFGPFDMPNLKGGTKDDWLTEKLTDAAEKFIEDSARDRKPFFLYLPEYTVHLPLQARQEVTARYRAKIGNHDFPNAIYAAMVDSFDVALGRIRAKLNDLGIAGETAIFITSDNGGLRYEGRSKNAVTTNAPLRAGKGHLYEGGIREPLIVHWPGVTRPGTVIDEPVSSVDYLPTIVEMAGGRAPRPPAIDGVSLTGLLRGRSTAPNRDALYWHYPHYSNQGGVPGGAVRQGDWKLIEFYEDSRLELFNLRDDPGETRNLVRKEAKVAARLHRMLRDWRKKAKATMPEPNPAYDPAKADQGLTGVEPATEPV
ncbi:MAG: sulfatase [Bryobacteraceae bacterium]